MKFESFVNYVRQTVGKNRLELGAKMQGRGVQPKSLECYPLAVWDLFALPS